MSGEKEKVNERKPEQLQHTPLGWKRQEEGVDEAREPGEHQSMKQTASYQPDNPDSEFSIRGWHFDWFFFDRTSGHVEFGNIVTSPTEDVMSRDMR